MITPNLPSNLANAVSPFSPVGKLPVGEENPDARNTPFKPVEELAETVRLGNRTSISERAAEADERVDFDPQSNAGDDKGRGNKRQAELDDHQQREVQEAEAGSERDSRQQQEDLQQIRQLSQRDREVVAHEQAHAAAGGQLTGAPQYQYQQGPDGVSYAVSGEVSISSGEVAGDPEATLQNARRVRQAALAPADPSPQDRTVAAGAAQMEQQAVQAVALQASEVRAQARDEAEATRAERVAEAQAQEGERESQSQLRREQTSEQQRVERQEAQSQANRQNVDINRRLIDIGVSEPPAPIGQLLNQIA